MPKPIDYDLTFSPSVHIVTDSNTGTKFATASNQKIGFFGASPVTQPSNTTDIKDCLQLLGLLSLGGSTDLNLDNGVFYGNKLVLGGTEYTETSTTALSYPLSLTGNGGVKIESEAIISSDLISLYKVNGAKNRKTVFSGKTTSAIPLELTKDGALYSAPSGNFYTIPINTTCAFTLNLTARRADGTSCFMKRMFVLKNIADAVSFEGNIQTIGVDINPLNVTFTIGSDVGTKRLLISVTGFASTTISWMASIEVEQLADL